MPLRKHANNPPSAIPPLPAGAHPPVRVIAVASGKGGVGKTTASVNLGIALAEAGKRTLLLDADLGLANVDVLLGLAPRFTLADLLAGRCTLEDIVVAGPEGLLIVPAASGKRHMAELKPTEHVGLIHAFSEFDRALDVMLVDTAAGIADGVLTFCQAAQDAVVVVCDEPASLTDAYALIKVLSRERGVKRVHMLANQTRKPGDGRTLYEKLARVCERFLDGVTLTYLGAVPHCDWLRRAVQSQQSVVTAFPGAPSALAFREIAARIAGWRAPAGPRGHVEFFVERMLAGGGVPA